MKVRFALLFLALLSSRAQDPAAIKVNVRLVNVSFTVRDAGGKLVTNLTKDDLEVLDDAQVQPIAFFARADDLPLTLGLIVDASGSQAHFVKQHEHDLKTFLKSVLSPRDQAFLVCFGNHVRLAADFSPTASDLIDGLKQFEKKSAGLTEIAPREYRSGGTAFYDALHSATTKKLAAADHGRRAIVVFSDGEDNSSARNMMETIEAAQAENVVIFGVRYTETRKDGEWTARNKYGASVMARISRETGGSDFDAHAANLRESFKEIGEQLRSSYELAYYASGPTDDTFHKLVIRAKQPGFKVRTKTGYFSREVTAVSSPLKP